MIVAEIKIFVSHRIDIDSEQIKNPLYYPVRCGAVFDEEDPMSIPGDNTGENISHRRMSFCEFTVQYWAWKNCQADYFGLCHYRRFLSFAEKRYPTNEYNMIHATALTPGSKRRYSLLDPKRMEKLIAQYDIITSEYADVKKIPTPEGEKDSVYELWAYHDGIFFERSVIEMMFQLIDEMAPEYSRSAREYFAGDRHRGFNCYILKKELFDRLCRFQFPIMFEVEKQIDTTGYTQTMLRTPAFVGEMLYGIFLYHVTTYEHWRVKELQLVFFSDTDRIKSPMDLFRRYLWAALDRGLRWIADPILPKGSRRREWAKDVFYAVLPVKRRGIAEIK